MALSNSIDIGPAAAQRTASPSPRVWVAHTSFQFAIDVASTLRRLHLEVELWDQRDSPALDAAEGDLVVADAACLRIIAGRLAAEGPTGAPRPRPRLWRGGLAPRVLRLVKQHVDDGLAGKVRLEDLATIAGLSGCHFSRAFKQSVGIPPHRYVMSRRIAVASTMIETTGRSLTEVALSVGFSDHSHFTRVFVRMTGETPRAHRRRHR